MVKRGNKKVKEVEKKIRAEQRVKDVLEKGSSYKKTDSYKNLSSREKKGFADYLKDKRVVVRLGIMFLFVGLVFVTLKPEITGKIVGDVEYKISSLLFYFIFILVVLVISAIVFRKRK